ncbi:Cys/Met metabolism PLP-dependent enzyme-domain-containing protein [Aspergillus pseudotamarii]|uniref:Cys/Met metabolism PLP-dependent enzyme-domain-containing protein n=1 Tax=Aspergillus pseudotamarii TaxID=132259 RepID=A0A5N6TBH3_ASPPS|nr:Cys/Met metabolism PLP-dependent enzyme-domain-containing protein [Aspergillus pseudotamarii]KAE8143646.1 Cys/Met metabolism PLP-dependent enzyme-domain-containing protein [Aspergillus pseudotamarii]
MPDAFTPFKVDLEAESNRSFDTRQIHSGAKPDIATRARAVPIYSTASYVFTDSEHARRVCTNQEAGYVYTRISNPTVEVLEKRVAALEGGTAAVACASGQSAVFQAILCLAHTGQNIVASTNLYGGSYSLFKSILPRLGISVKWVHGDDPESYRELIDDNTRLVFVETVGNPRISVPDLRAIADIAHAHNLPFVVDNTFGAGGYWCPVIEHGVDIVVHSATKWLGGHGTTVGGIIVDSGKFDWAGTGDKFPHLTRKSEGPMEFSYASNFGNIAFAIALRIEVVMEVGSVMNPFAAQQILLGIETLSLRCDRIAANALRTAEFLEKHPRIQWVSYPGLPGDKYHNVAKKYLRRGFGGVLSFGVKGGTIGSKAFVDALRLVSNMTNVGDCKTMATHPWSSTHSIMSEQDRTNAGITEDLIRLSVGTEDIVDIIEDLSRACAAIPEDCLRDVNGKVADSCDNV